MTLYRDVPLDDLPERHYGVVLADPAWRFLTWSKKGQGKSPDRHYHTMTLDEIKALPVRERCAENAVLMMWVIDTHLQMAFEVIEAWGFTFKTVGFTWAKTTKDGTGFPIGTGFWTRANPEMALEAEQESERALLATTKKPPKRQDAGVRRLIVAPRREHSRKPDETYDRIERLVNGPYLEMFSRNDRPGWDSWGDQAGMFNIHRRMRIDKDIEALI